MRRKKWFINLILIFLILMTKYMNIYILFIYKYIIYIEYLYIFIKYS